VDGSKAFLPHYGFAYTDDTGYFVLNYAGDAGQAPASDKAPASGQAAALPQLFVEVVDTNANPVYLSSTPFQPVLGTAIFQDIVLPAGGQPIGDPPQAIRDIAMPGKSTKPRTRKSSPKTSKS
jgi:hypothetical protein